MTAAVPRLADYLQHMAEAAAQACAPVEGLNEDAFRAELRTQQAVVFNLIVLGEAATQVLGHFGDFAASQPGIPWRSMKGMRNRIAHGYFAIDLQVVWATVRNALPQLLADLPAARAAAQRP